MATAKRPEIVSIDALRRIVKERQHSFFVWPEEGSFDPKGKFNFNAEHKDYEPLMIDTFSASHMVRAYDAVKESNQTKMSEWIGKSRAHFAKMHQISFSK